MDAIIYFKVAHKETAAASPSNSSKQAQILECAWPVTPETKIFLTIILVTRAPGLKFVHNK